MEKFKCVGYRKYDFTTENGVRQVGISFWFLKPAENIDELGLIPFKLGVSQDKLQDTLKNPLAEYPGKEVEVSFNRYGKPTSMLICK